jgi:hypothetical protein
LETSIGRSEAAYSDRRQELLRSIERDRAEMRRAVDDLRRAARKLSPRDRMVSHPMPWILGALLLGVWLGNRKHSRLRG